MEKRQVAVKKAYQLWTVFGLLFVLMPWGCAYNFRGGGELPNGVTKIFISVFENLTGEVGIETIFTNDLTNEFILLRKDALTSKEDAEAILSGVITSVRERTISETVAGRSLDREVYVYVSLKLKDKNGRVLWSATNIRDEQGYNVGASKIESELSKRVAIRELSQKMAERIYSRLTEDF
jgi:outer membrane lipopolysaccharide assembly protein LptE/RlpB